MDMKVFRKIINHFLLPFREGISFTGRMVGGQTFILFPSQSKEHLI